MKSYTYELQDPPLLYSHLRSNLLALGEEWRPVVKCFQGGTVMYQPLKANPMRSGYSYAYQRAKLNLTLYLPEKNFETLLELLDRGQLEILKGAVQGALPKRSGYDLNEFKIRGILGEEIPEAQKT